VNNQRSGFGAKRTLSGRQNRLDWSKMTLNGRGLPRDLKRAQNANGQFVLPGKLSKSRGVQRRDGCARFDLLVQTFAQFIILWDDAAMTRMRFERFEASMKLASQVR
jgi:hypothetical protein